MIEAVAGIAKETSVSSAQVSLAWLAAQPAVTSVILGARTRAQLADNLAAASLKLSGEQIERLTAISKPQAPEPEYFRGLSHKIRNLLQAGINLQIDVVCRADVEVNADSIAFQP